MISLTIALEKSEAENCKNEKVDANGRSRELQNMIPRKKIKKALDEKRQTVEISTMRIQKREKKTSPLGPYPLKGIRSQQKRRPKTGDYPENKP